MGTDYESSTKMLREYMIKTAFYLTLFRKGNVEQNIRGGPFDTWGGAMVFPS